MIQSYRIRLFPTPEQEQQLRQTVDAMRFVWNWGLAYHMERFKNGEKHLSAFDMKKVLTQLKKQDEYKWLNSISSHTLSAALLDLGDAYHRFFEIQKQGEKFTKAKIARFKRLNKKLTTYDMKGHPKFKKKAKAKQNFYVRYEKFYIMETSVNIEKIGKVEYQASFRKLKLPTANKKAENTVKFSNPRVSFRNDKWTLTFGMKCENQAQDLNAFAVGIDLGVKTLAVVSYDNGKKKEFKNINKIKRVRKLKKRLRHFQRKVSRKYHVNGNYDKTNNILEAEKKAAAINLKLANIRMNHIHHATAEITDMLPHTIVMEDLNVTGMMKNRHLSKAIQEQCFYEFKRQVEYKCERKGIKFQLADRFFPSSKTCSSCGSIKKDLKLKDRAFKCENCGLQIDRDLNASINLEKLAC